MKKIIETALPLRVLSQSTISDKARKGHPGNMHLWWNRSPIDSSTALLIAAMMDSNTEEFRAKINQLKNIAVGETPLPIKMNHLPAVCDPFSGFGGLTIAAQKAGLDVYASDLNAVATLLTKAVDLKFNQTVFSINQSDLLVKVDVAQKQLESEKATDIPAGPIPGGDNPSGGQGGAYVPGGYHSGGSTFAPNGGNSGVASPSTPPVAPNNKHFYMSVKLDNTRVNRDINNYVQEIIQHLMSVDGANVELKLEVEVEAPNGIPSTTVRTVSENCRTLKVTDFGFDD